MAINNVAVKETEGSKPVPEDLYPANLKEITEGTGQFGDYVKIAFEIADGEYKGSVKTMVASLNLSKSTSGKNSKLFDVVKAIMGVEPKIGDKLDLTQLIGKTCQILIVNGKEKDGIQYQNIGKVLPV